MRVLLENLEASFVVVASINFDIVVDVFVVVVVPDHIIFSCAQ